MALTNPAKLYHDIICLKSKTNIVERLEREKVYLNSNYNTVNSLKNGFTIYRNYLKENLSSTLKIGDESLLKICLDLLKLTFEQQAAFNVSKNKNIRHDRSNLRLIYDVKVYIEKNTFLLD